MPQKSNRNSRAKVTSEGRRTQALSLRKLGATYEKIGHQLGISTSHAHRLVEEAMRRLLAENREQTETIRTLELARLDQMAQAIWEHATKGSTRHIDRMLKIMARRAKYIGLDAQGKITPRGPEEKNPYDGLPEREINRRIVAILDQARDPQDEAILDEKIKQSTS